LVGTPPRECIGRFQWGSPGGRSHRQLLGKLSQAAWQTVAEMVDVAAGGEVPVRPGTDDNN